MEKIKFKIPKFSLLPNKNEYVVLNTFINASIKTFGFIIALQALTFIYWKRKFPVGKAIKYFMLKEWLLIPFSYYWYRKLKVSTYEELDKLDITITPSILVEQVTISEAKVEEAQPVIKPIIETKVNKIVEELKTGVKDKIHLSYVLE